MIDNDNLYNKHLSDTKAKLDSVSSSFCLAKWQQVTIHLQNGMNHSCHHPPTHVVPISEIKINSTALHNSEYKKQQRKLMLEGIRPSECDYCWRVEDSTQDFYSDRIHKSADKWALPYYDKIVSSGWQENINPSYVEISFSNVCNFKCSYCAPHISSSWMNEIEQYGPYPTSTRYNNLDYIRQKNMMPIPHNQDNPYVDAFWAWWPKMYSTLNNFRITGGEPLLAKDTFKILDYIIENPNPELEFSINTNMNPPQELFNKFLEKIRIINDNKLVKSFKLFTSAEAHGKQSEYIRHGMNYDLWLSNIHKTFKEIPDITFTIMSTYNILSLTSYTKFLADMLEIKRTYYNKNTPHNFFLLDIPYLRYPEHQAVYIMDSRLNYMIDEQINFMNSNLYTDSSYGFYKYEVDKLSRIQSIIKEYQTHDNSNIARARQDFVKFVDEHDRRRGSDFKKTFPELMSFYAEWKSF